MSLRRRLPFVPACMACGLAAFFFWRWMGAPVELPDAPAGPLRCLSYTPYEPGATGTTTPGWVGDARIEDDLRRLSALTGCLRLYTPLGNSPRVVAAAGRHDLQVLLGAWIGSDPRQNEREIRGALELARRHPGTVRLVVVGNEVLLRRELPAGRLAALLREVREASPVPVAYADVAHFIAVAPEVAAAADVLMIHLLPYWDDPAPPPAGEAAAGVVDGYDGFRTQFPGKAVMIGETGWPSAGRRRGPGRAGLVEQARFVREFTALAAARGIDYNLIEAVDQPWKRPAEGTVGGYWGLLDAQRERKFPLQGPVSAWPAWPAWASATAVLAALVLAAALPGGLGAIAWLAWTAIAATTALALVFQWRALWLAALSPAGWALGGVGALVSLGSAAVLLERLRTGRLAMPAPLVDFARALGKPATTLRLARSTPAAVLAPALAAAAWFSVVLAFAPRHRDLPLAFFVLPALAAAALLPTALREPYGDRREEAVLALVVVAGALAQLERANPDSVAWLALGALLATPWIGALRAELVRIGRLLADARQSQQRGQGA